MEKGYQLPDGFPDCLFIDFDQRDGDRVIFTRIVSFFRTQLLLEENMDGDINVSSASMFHCRPPPVIEFY